MVVPHVHILELAKSDKVHTVLVSAEDQESHRVSSVFRFWFKTGPFFR